MEEIWRNIEGFEGYYQVSNLGRVRSLPRLANTKNGAQRTAKGYYLSPVAVNNYLRVCFCAENKRSYHFVARLVGFAFPEICGEYFDGADINHLNEDKNDNRAVNLKWVSRFENNNWGTRNKRAAVSNRNGVRSIPVRCFSIDNHFFATFPSIREAERCTKVSISNIQKNLKGVYKSAGGYIWKYI